MTALFCTTEVNSGIELLEFQPWGNKFFCYRGDNLLNISIGITRSLDQKGPWCSGYCLTCQEVADCLKMAHNRNIHHSQVLCSMGLDLFRRKLILSALQRNNKVRIEPELRTGLMLRPLNGETVVNFQKQRGRTMNAFRTLQACPKSHGKSVKTLINRN